MKRVKGCFVLFAVILLVLVLAGPVWAEDTGKVNINKATVAELVKLKRVGPKYAARILEYREKNGPFKLPEDIVKVSGIGPKTWELNKNKITVE